MTKKQFRTCLQLLGVLLVLLITLTAYVAGKYIKTISFSGSVTFTSSLAESMVLQEHLAVRQDDGSYVLDMSQTASGNTYILIPGLDIPKDPYIIIEGKTPIPAYLYILVEESVNIAVTHELEDCWKRLADLDPTAPSNVYVYCTKNDSDEMIPTAITSDLTVNIIKNQTVFVSQYLLQHSESETDVLMIRAILKEKVGANTAVQTYKPNS